MKKSALLHFTCLIVLFALSPTAKAQNNPYKIDDEVYRLYTLAYDNKGTEEGLRYAEKAIKVAEEKGDMKGLCVATSSKISYYFKKNDAENVGRYAEELRQIATQSGYPQYYYHAYSQQINCLINCGQFVRALEIAKESSENAEKCHDNYGIFLSYRAMASVYDSRGQKDLAMTYYKEAVYWYWNTSLKDTQSISMTYINMAGVSDSDEEADKYLELAIANAKTRNDSLRYDMAACNLEFRRGSKEGFYEHYDHMKDMNVLNPHNSEYASIMVKDALFRKDFKAAKEYAGYMQTDKEKYSALAVISREEGDWKAAFEYSTMFNDIKDSLQNQLANNDLAEYSAMFDNQKIQYEAGKRKARLITVILLLVALLAIVTASGVALILRIKRRELRQLAEYNVQIATEKKKAENASRMKDIFVQNMSHEVRTPLNSIMGFSQLLATPGMEWSEEEKESFGSIITNNGQLLTMLIDDILNIADIENGNYHMVFAPTEVKKILDSAYGSVEYRIPAGVKFSMKCDFPEGYSIVTDASRVQQILINYLTNACKHTTKGGILLEASLEENPGMLTFSVTDTGTGVPEEEAENIFERFLKLNSFVNGTGLGLNICKTLAKILGGTVKLDTTYKAGARFVFVHPLDLKETNLRPE